MGIIQLFRLVLMKDFIILLQKNVTRTLIFINNKNELKFQNGSADISSSK